MTYAGPSKWGYLAEQIARDGEPELSGCVSLDALLEQGCDVVEDGSVEFLGDGGLEMRLSEMRSVVVDDEGYLVE